MEEHGEFESPFAVDAALSYDSEHKLRSENIPFDIDNWYPALREWTFESVFIPLSRPQARAMLRLYRFRFRGGDSPPPTPEDAAELQSLEDHLDDIIRERFADTGVFMRLCGRSAKDAEPLDRERVRHEYKAAVHALAPECRTLDEVPAPVKMRAAARVSVHRARTGAEVMNMLLSSERVQTDVQDWLWFGEPEQIVLRRWEDDLSVDYEFRLYVHNNSLNAISQYDHYCRYDHLFPLKDKLHERMVAMWRDLHPRVGAASYGMDLVYLPATDRLVFLELSPFLRCTGAHCFRWSNPVDVDVLEGRSPFEFRLVEESISNFDSMFSEGWDERWFREDNPKVLLPFWTWYQTAWERRACAWKRRVIRHRWAVVPAVAAGAAAVQRLLGFLFLWCLAVGAMFVFAMRYYSARSAEEAKRKTWTPIFFYGTLMRDYHWNKKFLSHGAHFVAPAVTVTPFPLVVGKCGVPYLLGDQEGSGHRVRGELWLIDADTLEGLDQYEGLGKQYYSRTPVDVETCEGGVKSVVNASMYTITSVPELLALPMIPEYSLRMHKEQYKPVEHILLKQQLYLQGSAEYNTKRVHPSRSVSEDALPSR